MRDYSDQLLLDLASEWYWIVSDRAGEFDDLIRRPFRDPEAVRAATLEYLDATRLLHPGEPESEVARLFREMLARLEAKAEDADRIAAWAYCLSPDIQPEPAQRALAIWSETFGRFARGRRDRARHMDEDRLEELALSYTAEVVRPIVELDRAAEASRRAWLDSPGRRTPWDEVLWERFFREVYVDPSVDVSLGYESVLVREWWRGLRPLLTDAEVEQLRREQTDNMRTFALNPPAWKLDGSITEAMLLEGIPRFDEVARSPA